MPYTGTAYRIYYAARDYKTGLTDVRYYVYKPNGIKLGPYSMTELNVGTAKGIYVDDFLDSDIEGKYLFIADCPSYPKQDESSDWFESRVWQNGDRTTVLGLLTFIKDTEKGNWEIVGTQMIFRKEDGTELMRFNLLNESGFPTNGESNGAAFKRVRV